jgi:hypothetical protein
MIYDGDQGRAMTGDIVCHPDRSSIRRGGRPKWRDLLFLAPRPLEGPR